MVWMQARSGEVLVNGSEPSHSIVYGSPPPADSQ
ncbi:hypothetical protein RS9916_33837 [Synechococcus sp. RS9916]|nr:hypothetical protein RS9916_33837 [Synechococcus sp. RS9916]